MMAKQYLLKTEEDLSSRKDAPVLIIDKDGLIGSALTLLLAQSNLVVFVSKKNLENTKNIIHIPFNKRIPSIPDNLFAKIFVLYQGEKEILAMLPALSAKAKESNGSLFFITSVRAHSEKLSEKILDYSGVTYILYGDIFGRKEFVTEPVESLVYTAKKVQRVLLKESGLSLLYPITFVDVVEGIIAVSFDEGIKSQAICLFPKQGYTELSLARFLKRLYPDLIIDFHPDHKTLASPVGVRDGHYFYPSYPLFERLKANLQESGEYQIQEGKRVRRFRSRFVRFPIVSLAVICALVIFSIPLLLLVSAGAGLFFLNASVAQAQTGKNTTAKQYASFAENSFAIAANAVLPITVLSNSFGGIKTVEQLQENLGLGKTAAHELQSLFVATELLARVSQGKSLSPKEDFTTAITKLKSSIVMSKKLKAEQYIPSAYLARLQELEAPMELFLAVSDSFSEVFGFEGKRIYLVLFQNNMELRPGGGFIGSYGIARLTNGRLEAFAVHDVYDADGQLKGHIDPPFALKRYLGASHWYLRDSNFSLDFPTNAAEAMRFLQLETGESVDGVIGVDLSFLTTLLSVTGPITLPDYKKTVTNENFFLVAETQIEKGFFPGSTQKKDFLSSFATALTEKLFSDEQKPLFGLLTATTKAMQQKHLQFYFVNQPSQKIFAANGLTGAIVDRRKEKENTFFDFIAINEANVGMNKVNYYVDRRVEHTVQITETGEIDDTLLLSLTNTSTTTSPFGGSYKVYLQILRPFGTTLQEIAIDGQEQQIVPAVVTPSVFESAAFIPPAGIEVEQRQLNGKTLFGLLITVSPQSTKRIQFKTAQSRKLITNDSTFAYDLMLVKQAGLSLSPYIIRVDPPNSFKLLFSSLGESLDKNSPIFPLSIDSDTRLEASFTKN